jgi:excisionase family DNA binding protein
MGVQVLNLDRDTAGHLAVAIRLYVIRQEETGASYPHALVELRDLATDAWVAMRLQDTPSTVRFGDAVGADAYGRGDAYRVSQKQAARELGVSVRTVQRLVDQGELEAPKVNGRRRLTRGSINRFELRRGDS